MERRAGARALALALAEPLRLAAHLRPRHLRYVPPALTFALSDVVARLAAPAPAKPAAPLAWGRGVSVVIPERGAAAMLAPCLEHLAAALARIDEPAETIVVVNGSDLADYAALAAAHPDVRWLHSAAPLGFTSAVLLGLREVRHGATYLLNNDMLLEPDALAAALAARAPDVFAVASQIHFQDRGRRREETGWTSLALVDALPDVRHETPEDAALRGTAWAGAGSSLFHTALLRRLLPGARVFDPFYWEDVDLGVRAWREGYASLFCPASVAWHRHRATVARLYEAAEVERIFERNRVLLALRHPVPCPPLLRTLQLLGRLPPASRAELSSWRACAALWRARTAARRAPFRDVDYATLWTARLALPRRPAVVVVTPFAVLPAVHGGAVRTVRLAAALARDYEVVLLSDERALYPPPGPAGYAPFAFAHLVGARAAEAPGATADRIARIGSHSCAALQQALARTIALHRPAAVLVSHMELGGLVATPIPAGAARPPFILDLHDVLLCPDDPAQRAADAFELALIERFDGVVVCSPEDRALLGERPARLVGNGFDAALAQAYRPSRGRRNVLFVGPFRVPNNWQGICRFLERAWPRIEAAVAGATLTIVGGAGAAERAAGQACFARASVTVVDRVDDLSPLRDACALTINPQSQLRGSSLKVIEIAGRGARLRDDAGRGARRRGAGLRGPRRRRRGRGLRGAHRRDARRRRSALRARGAAARFARTALVGRRRRRSARLPARTRRAAGLMRVTWRRSRWGRATAAPCAGRVAQAFRCRGARASRRPRSPTDRRRHWSHRAARLRSPAPMVKSARRTATQPPVPT